MKMLDNLAVLFSKGAFGDCARHAILHAMEDTRVRKIRVYATSMDMESLMEEANWKCGCGGNHGAEMQALSSKYPQKLEMIPVSSVTDPKEMEATLFNQVSMVEGEITTAVISGLGNRQIMLGDRVGKEGTKNVVTQMKKVGITRLVAMSSVGIHEDYPSLEWRNEGTFLDGLFMTICIREYWDLCGLENEAKVPGINYLIVRPVGLGEEVKPAGKYFIQKQKGEDVLGANMAKSDVGLFLLEEALKPTYERKSVVIGADPAEAFEPFG